MHKVAKSLTILITPDVTGLAPGQVKAQFEYYLYEDPNMGAMATGIIPQADMPESVYQGLNTAYQYILKQAMDTNQCLTKAEADEAFDAAQLSQLETSDPTLWGKFKGWLGL